LGKFKRCSRRLIGRLFANSCYTSELEQTPVLKAAYVSFWSFINLQTVAHGIYLKSTLT